VPIAMSALSTDTSRRTEYTCGTPVRSPGPPTPCPQALARNVCLDIAVVRSGWPGHRTDDQDGREGLRGSGHNKELVVRI
jgi:hypothetical protein